ncbi:AAA family ATPase [Vibrio parahaemolyticus]|uniref:AAA family ATPase n=1 Tax=Vibrio parahaemolyticus TaxID=670 RepID=UPI00112287CD|nr:AAA family ATPase [Vibrio parahaemolyticus]TOD62435.1 hypothetical protein CGJ59_23065 [Vibrio parahaemolyticus]
MKVVWIHGAPASGKLTVAKELSSQYGYKLLHNHLAVDLSLSIYDKFGEKDFHEFTDSIRRTTLKKAKDLGVTHVVLTWVVCSQLHQREIQGYLDFFQSEQMDVYPIHLAPSKEELLRRVVADSRKSTYKISCIKQLSEYLEQCEYAPISTDNTLTINNTSLSPEQVVERIVSHIH